MDSEQLHRWTRASARALQDPTEPIRFLTAPDQEDRSSNAFEAELYWSFRSPYSYLGAKHYREFFEQYDLDMTVRPVLPIAIRNPDFFAKVNPPWLPYAFRDCARIAEYRGLSFGRPSPNPIVQDMETRKIPEDQPYIYWFSRFGIEAARQGRGLPFIEEVSTMICGGASGERSVVIGYVAEHSDSEFTRPSETGSGKRWCREPGRPPW